MNAPSGDSWLRAVWGAQLGSGSVWRSGNEVIASVSDSSRVSGYLATCHPAG
jgi:hypothetical protein